jgi:hypothetical protein
MVQAGNQYLRLRTHRMFKEGDYDVTEFSMAANGMNQFISPDVLPSNFCYSLENIIPDPLGTGQVRYGTSFVKAFANSEFNIIRSFPFTLNGNINQSILYVGYYEQDLTVSLIGLVGSSLLSFNSTTPTNFVQDTKIKIVYTYNGITNTLYSDLKVVSIAGSTVTATLGNNLFPDPTAGVLLITEIWCQFGAIYSYNFNTDTLSAALASNLSIGCVPRESYFQQKMLICNGVDNVKYWDGTNLNDVSEFIVETQANGLIRINATSFSLNKLAEFDVLKYYVGNSIKLSVDDVITTLVILTAITVGNVVTITTTTATVPAFTVPPSRVSLFYQDKPPKFSYIYVARDRIWALGPGAVGLQYRDTNEQLRVYYSYRPNAVTGYGLFNENTKTVPSIDMSDKHSIQDNFEAICQVNDLMAFMGRKLTQVWGGYTPGQGGNFSWNANLQVGILHGDLLIEMPNDVYFVSQSGINSFSTLNIAQQFSANSDNAVDTITKNFISDATASNSNYRKCTSFKYDGGKIAGFKIAGNKILSSLFSTKLYSWFYLSGDFSLSSCFMNLGSQLYMCIGNKIFKYANGNDGDTKKYGDNNGASLIPISWTPGLIKFRGRKGYANRRYEMVINYPSSFTLNERNLVEISIFGDIPKSFSISDKCNFQSKGDLLGQEPLSQNGVLPTDSGFRLRKEYEIVNKRLKFVSSSFWLSVYGYVMNGPVTFRRVRLFGIGERNA